MSACVCFRSICFRVLCLNALCGFVGLPLLGNAPLQAQTRTTSRSPADSLNQIELAAGYRLELLAHEPLVIDPVEVAFDTAGRMWVVEMRDYPFRIADKPQGTIRILIDSDGDGRFDRAQVFADQLEMPTGLAFWKDGVVVTLAGKLLFLRDTNGDLVADETQIWLEGFAEENEQLRANHPRLSPDGQWTIASGLRGGQVRLGSDWLTAASPDPTPVNPLATAAPLEIGSRDIRFDPLTGAIELITGPAQFGLCFDPFGQRYFCSNRNPAVKVIFEQEDLLGNPLAGLLPSVLDVVPAGEASQVFPLIDAWTTSNLHAGQFTAACGVLVRADQDANLRVSEQVIEQEEQHAGQPASLRFAATPLSSEIFMCEPTGSLVKRSVVQQRTRYESPLLPTPSADQREWLASRDAWFRPVNVAHTPDGGVAIVDMHRAVIEHPAWVPDELKQRPDERWGDDCGRIFAVHSVDPSLGSVDSFDTSQKATHESAHETTIDSTHAASRAVAARRALMRDLQQQPLHLRSDADLAQQVAIGNPWFQENAARLLLERQAAAVIPQLLEQAADSSLPRAGRAASVRLVAGLTRSASPVAAG
jgi:putative membrane-bound dehydrogenase-like protein